MGKRKKLSFKEKNFLEKSVYKKCKDIQQEQNWNKTVQVKTMKTSHLYEQTENSS